MRKNTKLAWLMHNRPSRRAVFGAVALAVALPLIVSCGVSSGDLDPGCIEGSCLAITGLSRPPDGRDLVFGNMTPNMSMTETVSLVSVKLIDAVGLELVDAFTVSADNQICIGMPVPPVPADVDIIGSIEDWAGNWAMRIPLAGSEIAPNDARQIVLQLRPTTADQCVYAKGYTTTYEEGGRKHSVDSNLAMIVFIGDDSSVCDSVSQYLEDNPIG